MREVVNGLNRKCTFIFLEFEEDLLHEILKNLKGILCNNPEDVKDMIEELTDTKSTENIKRVNLLTTNFDETIESEIQVIW